MMLLSTLPPHMLRRLAMLATAWLVWQCFAAGTNAIMHLGLPFLAMIFLASTAIASWAVRRNTQPLTQRARFAFFPHMFKPQHRTEEQQQQRNQCIQDLEKIGTHNCQGLNVLWKDAMQQQQDTNTTTTILLTGVTGYVGRAVLLQLLRRIIAHKNSSCCKIILMTRAGKENSARDRIESLRQEDTFADIPKVLWNSVISVIETNNLYKPDLGCTKEALQQLRDAKVTHIVHSAADVTFMRDLKSLAASNITAALQLQAFARTTPSCQRMVFVSTAFVNPHTSGTPEQPLLETLASLEGFDPEALYHSMLGNQRLARQAMAELGFENHYVFSKCVAEHLLSRDPSSQLCIVRPGIVGPAFVLPQPGWNGAAPSTVTAYTLMWLSKLIRVNCSANAPFPQIPVDVVAVGVVNAMIMPLADRSIMPNSSTRLNCEIKNLVWASNSKNTFVVTDDLISDSTAFGVFAGHLSTTEAALAFALNGLTKAKPGMAVLLHEIFNKGPLRLIHFIQDFAAFHFGFNIAPAFPASKFLKLVRRAELYNPYIGDSYHFQSDLHIPDSFNVDGYMAAQFKTVNEFLSAEAKSPARAVTSDNKILLAPSGRWDLWWALTQPRGSLGVRLVCYGASKVIRTFYDDVTLDLETTLAALEGLPKTSDEDRIVLFPSCHSMMDVILVLYVTFAFPFLGIDIPYILADQKTFEESFLTKTLQWILQCNSSSAPPKKLQCALNENAENSTMSIFLDGSQENPQQTTVLRTLQKDAKTQQANLIPVRIDHYESFGSVTCSKVLRHIINRANDDTCSRQRACISFGNVNVLKKSSDVDNASAQLLKAQRSLSTITWLHLAASESHLKIPQSVLIKAMRQLGGRVSMSSKPHCHMVEPLGVEENWRLHTQWMHHFAGFFQQTHPHWAARLFGVPNLDPADDVAMTAEVEKVVNVLQEVFDMADALATEAFYKLQDNGITPVSAAQLQREMDALLCSSWSEAAEWLSGAVSKTAASIVMDQNVRLEKPIAASSDAPVAPVFSRSISSSRTPNQKEASMLKRKVEEALASVLKVDLLLAPVSETNGIDTSPAAEAASQSDISSAVIATLLTSTTLSSNQVELLGSGNQQPAADVIAYPASEAQCVELTNVANQDGFGLVFSSKHANNLGRHRPLILVDLCRMNTILGISKEAGLVHVQAGMTGKELALQLQQQGLALHNDLASQERAIGRYLSKKSASKMQVQAVRLVTANGIMGPNVGQDIAVNPTRSSFDLSSLSIGAEGRIGIITSAVLRVKPQSEFTKHEETILFRDFQSGVEFLQEVAQLGPGMRPYSMKLLDSAQMKVKNLVHGSSSGDLSGVQNALIWWRGFDNQNMCSCKLVFEGTHAAVSAQKQVVLSIGKKRHGIQYLNKEHPDVSLADCDFPSLMSDHFTVFTPWSQYSEMYTAAKTCVQVAHRARNFPGEPLLLQTIAQVTEQGAFVQFELLMYMSGVHKAPKVFGGIVADLKTSCMHPGAGSAFSEDGHTMLSSVQKTLDPNKVFWGGIASVEKPKNAAPEPSTTSIQKDDQEDSIHQAFDRAVEHIKRYGTSNSLSDVQKLQLYGLYKHATQGPCRQSSTCRPAFFDVVGRKKYDAWLQVGSEVSKEKAMEMYVQTVESIASVSFVTAREDQISAATPVSDAIRTTPSTLSSAQKEEGISYRRTSTETTVEVSTDSGDEDGDDVPPEGVAKEQPRVPDDFPLLPPRWYIFVLLGCLAYFISSYSLWSHAAVFYAITWTVSPFGDWSIALALAQRSLSGRYGNLPLRFNLVGLSFLAWLTFVRFPLETVLWYLDEIFFSDYNSTAIKEPVFLLGQPRSGTTKFQDVLSEDTDNFVSMKLYEMRFPYLTVQYLVDLVSKVDQQYLNGQLYLLADQYGLLYVLPETGARKAMRRLRYDLPDEDDSLLLFHGLSHFMLAGMFPDASTTTSLYQFSSLPLDTRRRLCQFQQKAIRKVMYRRGGEQKRYLCKWVAGCWNGLLDQVVEDKMYPDAKYINILRPATEQLPSWMKLQGLLSEQIAGHNLMKMPAVQRTVIDINAQWYRAQMQFLSSTDNVCMVSLEDFVRDIPGQVARVYKTVLRQDIVPGSSFHCSLLAAHRQQSRHKKTVVSSEEQFISAEEIAKRPSFALLKTSLAGRSKERPEDPDSNVDVKPGNHFVHHHRFSFQKKGVIQKSRQAVAA